MNASSPFSLSPVSSRLRMTFNPQTPIKIEKLKQKPESLGLGECEHFVATWRGGNRGGYLYIKRVLSNLHTSRSTASTRHKGGRRRMKGREVPERLEELIREGEERGALTELPRGVAEIEPAHCSARGGEEDVRRGRRWQVTHICNGCCWRRGGRVDDDLLPLQ